MKASGLSSLGNGGSQLMRPDAAAGLPIDSQKRKRRLICPTITGTSPDCHGKVTISVRWTNRDLCQGVFDAFDLRSLRKDCELSSAVERARGILENVGCVIVY